MKKKLLILLVFLLLLAGVSCLVMQVKKKNAEENKTPEMIVFETAVKEMYGERDYIGPMTEDIEPLTEEILDALNGEEGWSIEHDEIHSPNKRVFLGRCNTEKIKDVYDARKVAYQMLQYMGVSCDEYSLLYGDVDQGTNIKGEAYTSYIFQQYYKGVYLEGSGIEVVVNNKGDTYIVSSWCVSQDEMNIDSLEPKYQDDKLQEVLEKNYGECKIRTKELYLYYGKDDYMLEWYIEIDATESPIDRVWMNANSAEITCEEGGDIY